jgi:hypothetical protein
LQAPPEVTRPEQLEALHGLGEPLDRQRSQRRDPHQALHQPQGGRGQQDAPRRRQVLHTRRQDRMLPHRRVVRVQIVANGPHHHLAGVEPHPKVHGQAMRAPHLIAVAAHPGLHGQRRIARPDGMVFMGNGGAEERHDPIAHDLIHRALEAVHGLHHPFEDGIEDGPGFLRVAVGQQLHRAFEVGEEHGDLLTLPFQGGLRVKDFLRQMHWGIA